MYKFAVAVTLIITSGLSIQSIFALESGHLSYTNSKTQSADAKTLSIQSQVIPNTVVKQFIEPKKNRHRGESKFIYEPNLDDKLYTYIVELEAPSVLDIPELHRQVKSVRANNKLSRLNTNQDLQNHLKYLQQYRRQFLRDAGQNLSETVVAHYEYVLNGLALRLNQEQAQRLSAHHMVKRITRETIYQRDTYAGPPLVGAPSLWQGGVGNVAQTQGEGVVVGIIDSGINSDHPSFAERSGDGFLHTNPLGDGVFLGDCAGQFPQLCNNKMIGVYSYPDITNSYSDTDVFPPNLPRNGEDYDGHGSHVAAIAAGNVLVDVEESLPTIGEIESDGTPTGLSFEQISGVAPRANLIVYQVCFVGNVEDDDTYAGCPGSAINKGIEDAIKDGVDVINFSISGGGDPWRDSTESAFLRAQSVGIFVAVSAGNSGPDESSSEKHSPWYTAVAASEHGSQNAFVKEITNFSGGVNAPTVPINGQSNTANITADIVYARDFPNPNDPSGDPAQCLQAYPANTFSNVIVLCDRGDIARVQKAENVAAGGAIGFVLANVSDSESFLANDAYVIPGIHINQDGGNILKQWLSQGSNHRASITSGTIRQTTDPSRVDVLASFSSRGPNTTISTLTPMLSAPGVDIYSAYADQQFGHDGHDSPAGDFNYLSGTSMSSPHVAGAAALLKSLNPQWTPDNIRSALALTAVTSVRREDGSTTADFFDMGSGRIQVDLAAQTGLIMNETNAAYRAAEPAIGGEPRNLNLPSITDNECLSVCTWTRTFTATQDGQWSVNAQSDEDGLEISVNPSSFGIQAGQTQEIEVSIDTTNANKNRYIFGQVNFSANNSPDLHLPISVLSTIGDIPTLIETSASRDTDSVVISDIEGITLDTFVATPFALVKANKILASVGQDSNPNDYFDDLNDGVVINEINIDENAKRLIIDLVDFTARDLDLYLVYDRNNDGLLARSEEIAASQSFDSSEEIQINYPKAGQYFIVVQNFTSSNLATDSFELRFAVVGNDQNDSLQIQAPSSIDADIPFELRVIYQLENAELGDNFYGAIDLGSSSQRPANIGLMAVDITRTDDDISISGNAARVNVGDTAVLNIDIAGNDSNEDRRYAISIDPIEGTQFVNVGNGNISDNGLEYVINKSAGETSSSTLTFGLNLVQALDPGPIEIRLNSELLDRSFVSQQQSAPFTLIQVEGPPAIDFNGNESISLSTFEGRDLIIPITVTDPNQDPISLIYTQTDGPQAQITQTNGVSTLRAPSVDENTVIRFNVAASDGNDNQVTASFSVNVLNNLAPTINSISAPTSVNEGQRITITVSASDPESDNLSITINGVTGSSFSATAPRGVSIQTFAILVSDGINTVSQTVSVNVTELPESGGGSSSALYLIVLMCTALIRRKL